MGQHAGGGALGGFGAKDAPGRNSEVEVGMSPIHPQRGLTQVTR